jgi:spore coat protein A
VALDAVRDGSLFEPFDDMANGGGEEFFTGHTNIGEKRRGVIAFDLSAIPSGSTVNSVVLTLRMSRTQAGSTPVSLHRMLVDWGEGDSCAAGVEDCGQGGGAGSATQDDTTWDHSFFDAIDQANSVFWSNPGANGDFVVGASATQDVDGNGFYDWDSASNAALISDAQGWVDNAATNFGWIVIGLESGNKTAKRFNSRESNNASRRPVLSIDFAPPTSTGACCGETGSCTEVTSTVCSAAGGAFLGTSEICSPDPCLAGAGACCATLDGSCLMVLDPGGSCTSGTYEGAGSVCDPNTCPPPPTGACCFPDAVATCTIDTQLGCEGAAATYQGDATSCGPNPCPVVLTPFQDPLPLPLPANPISGTQGGAATYNIAMREVTQQLHQDLAGPTTVWGYSDATSGAGYPGPTIEATSNLPITINWKNELPAGPHYLNVDTCPHGADDQTRRTVVHVHGAHVAAAYDGHPEATFLPGQEASYIYENNQLPSTIWYHDHALGITRLNVYMGLAGFFIIRDAFETALGLPSGEFELPLAIQDRTFNPDGSLKYPSSWQDTFFGDTMLVNGKVWPVHNVKKGKYRLRLLNGCNSRVLTLQFCAGENTSPCPSPETFQLLGMEGGLLPTPVALTEVTLGGAERADVVVDFAPFTTGTEIYLVNSAPAPFPGTPGEGVLPDVMQFVVQAATGFTDAVPASLRSMEVLDPIDAIENRTFELKKGPADTCSPFVWEVVTTDGLNGAELGSRWDDISEYPELGTTEVWSFINRSGMTHPMHMHLVMFQVLDRQPFDVEGPDVVPSGPPVPPPTYESGWKDTVRVAPGEIVRVIARFDDYTGRFPYHCHILEHEDHEMMREFQVIECGNGVVEPTEECDDGGTVSGDGCSAICEVEDSLALYGIAFGGTVDLSVNGVPLVVPTTSGQSAGQVAQAIADVINADPTLSAAGVTAGAVDNTVFTDGTLSSVVVNDPGLSTTPPPVPALPALWLLVALMAFAAAIAIFRRRHA